MSQPHITTLEDHNRKTCVLALQSYARLLAEHAKTLSSVTKDTEFITVDAAKTMARDYKERSIACGVLAQEFELAQVVTLESRPPLGLAT